MIYKSFDDLLDIVSKDLKPNLVVIADKFHFFWLKHKTGEYIVQHVAKFCFVCLGIIDLPETLLRDKLVCGLNIIVRV